MHPCSRRHIARRAMWFWPLMLSLAAYLALFALPGHALAAARLQSSQPAADSIMPIAPSTVTLLFTEGLDPNGSTATVVDSHGASVTQGAPTIPNAAPTQMIVPLLPILPFGTYTVTWKSMSLIDRIPQNGTFHFTVGLPPTVTPAPTHNPLTPSSTPQPTNTPHPTATPAGGAGTSGGSSSAGTNAAITALVLAAVGYGLWRVVLWRRKRVGKA